MHTITRINSRSPKDFNNHVINHVINHVRQRYRCKIQYCSVGPVTSECMRLAPILCLSHSRQFDGQFRLVSNIFISNCFHLFSFPLFAFRFLISAYFNVDAQSRRVFDQPKLALVSNYRLQPRMSPNSSCITIP